MSEFVKVKFAPLPSKPKLKASAPAPLAISPVTSTFPEILTTSSAPARLIANLLPLASVAVKVTISASVCAFGLLEPTKFTVTLVSLTTLIALTPVKSPPFSTLITLFLTVLVSSLLRIKFAEALASKLIAAPPFDITLPLIFAMISPPVLL